MSRVAWGLLVVGIAGALPAQGTEVTFPAELAVTHGNAYIALGFQLGTDSNNEVYTRNTPGGWYFAAGFRACAGAQREVPEPRVLDVVLRIVPGVVADPLADDLNAVYDPNGGTVIFNGPLTIGPVAPPPDPLVDIALAADAPIYRVPFQAPVSLSGGTMWVWRFVPHGPAVYVDAHVQQALFESVAPQLVPGLRATDPARSCAETFGVPEPLLLLNDYGMERYRLRGQVANAGPGVAQVLLVGRLLMAPIPFACDLWVDPSACFPIPISPDGPPVSPIDLAINRPATLGFTPVLAYQQVQAWPDGQLRSTPIGTTIAPPWVPGGFDIDAKFVVNRMNPGWQWFPIMLAWKD